MRATGRNFSVEQCHWGAGGSIGCAAGDDASACPTDDWCPFNFYRVGGDQAATMDSWFDDLQNVAQFSAPAERGGGGGGGGEGRRPLSRPHCWAYPDMMEVGNILGADGALDVAWNRAHFGAWCITSAPLILGMALTDEQLEPVLDIIGNR